MKVGCEGNDGLIRTHDESETCDVCSTNKRDGGEVELLPLPDEMRFRTFTYDAVQAYARANVERALAEIEEMRSEVEQAKGRAAANLQRAADAEARAERLAGLLRQCRDEMAGLPHSLGYDFTHLPKIDAALEQEPQE